MVLSQSLTASSQHTQLQLNMNPSNKVFTQLRSKGYRAKPRLENGSLVVGYGHKIVPGDGVANKDIIDPVKATALLLRDVEQTVAKVVVDVPKNISQEEFDNLIINSCK